tara:strand:- start:334 stop:606 length:273 start_codon:yes stop_codon:yes gene_type:complete
MDALNEKISELKIENKMLKEGNDTISALNEQIKELKDNTIWALNEQIKELKEKLHRSDELCHCLPCDKCGLYVYLQDGRNMGQELCYCER